jgi:hypothetical protein
MSSELLNGDKIMSDGSKRTYVNGLVTFIAYPVGTTKAQMILPKEINRIEGVQVNSIVLPPPTYTSSYNIDDFQRAIDDGIRMTSYQKASNDIPYAAGGIKTRGDLDSYQRAIDDGIKTATFNNLQDQIRGEPSFISDNYILIIILSISILILLILFFIYKNKKSMNVENIIASFGLI